uniref:Mediator of RNA polymerase II transcription subunit 23 n=1 Tax=Heligmosomoides polygyrus TaxID=6339 RepID=A0A8L8L183_HELPZ
LRTFPVVFSQTLNKLCSSIFWRNEAQPKSRVSILSHSNCFQNMRGGSQKKKEKSVLLTELVTIVHESTLQWRQEYERVVDAILYYAHAAGVLSINMCVEGLALTADFTLRTIMDPQKWTFIEENIPLMDYKGVRSLIARAQKIPRYQWENLMSIIMYGITQKHINICRRNNVFYKHLNLHYQHSFQLLFSDDVVWTGASDHPSQLVRFLAAACMWNILDGSVLSKKSCLRFVFKTCARILTSIEFDYGLTNFIAILNRSITAALSPAPADGLSLKDQCYMLLDLLCYRYFRRLVESSRKTTCTLISVWLFVNHSEITLSRVLLVFRILDRLTCREYVLAVNALTDYIISQCSMIRVLNMMVFHRHVMTFDRLLLSLVLHPATDHASQIALLNCSEINERIDFYCRYIPKRDVDSTEHFRRLAEYHRVFIQYWLLARNGTRTHKRDAPDWDFFSLQLARRRAHSEQVNELLDVTSFDISVIGGTGPGVLCSWTSLFAR